MTATATPPRSSTPHPTRPGRGRRLLGALGAAVALMLTLGTGPVWAMASPNLVATSSPSTTVGLQIFDHTNLMGGASATGTISFALYGPGDTACANPIFTTSVPVSGTGSDDGAPYWTTSAGTYRWIAAYSGDQNNNPMTTPCTSPSQAVIVDKHRVGEALTTSQGGGVLHAAFALTGGMSPTGTATFTVTGPNDTWCAGTPVFTSTVAINGDGNYDSGSFRPTVPGTYTFRLRYDGDANNFGVGPTNCIDQNASVTVAQALFTNPTSGQPLDMTHPVSWTPISGAQAYMLSVGTTRGGGDLASIGLPGSTTSFDVSMLPAERTLYARLWTEVGNVWVGFQDVRFTTSGQGAIFTAPTEGQFASTTHVTWSPVAGADRYGLWVGTSKATADVASAQFPTTASSFDVPSMPPGQKLYARLWTRIDGAWARYQDISFAAPAG